HAEALADASGDEELAARRAVADGVAGEHSIGVRVARKRPDGDHTATHALADVVLRLAVERQLDARVEERAEALAGAASILPPLARGEGGTDGALRVVDGAGGRRRRGRLAVAPPCAPARKACIGGGQHIGEVEPGVRRRLQQLDPTDYVLERDGAHARKVLADLLGDQE